VLKTTRALGVRLGAESTLTFGFGVRDARSSNLKLAARAQQASSETDVAYDIYESCLKQCYQNAADAGRKLPPSAVALLKPSPAYGPNCDCDNVDWGILTPEHRQRCMANEQALLDLTKGARNEAQVVEKLQLKQDANGNIASGACCDGEDCGPNAWPVMGGRFARPPNLPPGRGTNSVPTSTSGITRTVVK
jgi:hypothetical protein